tara:strand:- start:361 stop:912 length:552 start_codon:yes stop_codon:yes gene_type:complete
MGLPNNRQTYGPWIQVDMDGVIADFFGGFATRFGTEHWKLIPRKEQSILELTNTDFFNTLKPFDTSARLIAHIKKISNGDWGINSSPLRGDRDNSAYWKRVWLERHGFMPKVSNLIFTGQKENHAINELDGSPNILIDDKPSNITKWEAKGGIGIRYQANEDDLEEYLFAKLEAIIEKKPLDF